MEYNQTREIAPFFANTLDEVFRNRHKKQLFLMVAGVRYGKTTNFTLGDPYKIAHHIKPVKQDNKMVRESLWFGIRESENAAVETFLEAITDSLFSPAIMASDNSPVKTHGNHPRFITIEHDLNDGTLLRMIIECHGFNTPNAENRIRSRSCLGVMIPEMQGVPKEVVKTAMERAGTWRPEECQIEYNLDGKDIVIAGASELKMVFADINIPTRPHYVYDMFFDNLDIDQSGYMVIDAPKIVIPKDIHELEAKGNDIDKLKETYPVSRYKKQDVMWLPNPDAYQMTKHWERLNEQGNKIPWTGYEYWYAKIRVSTESEINRLVLGIPDSIGGEASVYPNFDKLFHIKDRDFKEHANIYVGIDPGKNSGFTFFQTYGTDIHLFHELYFDSEDSLSTRSQIEGFLMPLIRGRFRNNHVKIVIDPAGKFSSSLGESPISILKEYNLDIVSELKRYKIANQNIEVRKSSLEYFIDNNKITVSPSCKFIIKALSGGFCYEVNRAGIISSNINKTNPFSHIAESAQYAAIVLYKMLIKQGKTNGKRKTRIFKLGSK